MAVVAGVPVSVGATLFWGGGGVVELLVTLIWNAGSCVQALPSVTSIWIIWLVPTLDSAGVPLSAPVEVLNVAQAGMLVARKVSASPSGSPAVGVKL
jgi:hypothetical protein